MALFERNPSIDADVNLLLGTFRDLTCNGRIIKHVEVEALLKIKRRSPRYNTVTNRWRRTLLEEQRIFLDGRAAHGQGFKSLEPDEMIRYSNRRIREIGRHLRKAIKVNSLPHPAELSTSQLRTYQARLMVACEQIVQTHHRVLVDLGRVIQPPRQLPRASGQ